MSYSSFAWSLVTVLLVTAVPFRSPAQLCVGDCDSSGVVTVDDLVVAVNIALGNAPVADCSAIDANSDGRATVDELITAVNRAFVGGCQPGTTTLDMQPDLAGGFLSFPWPNDVRKKVTGTIDMRGYPGADVNLLIALILESGSNATRGFGTNSAIHFQTSAPMDRATLPSVEDTLRDNASFMLVNLDDPTAPRIPLLVDFKKEASKFRPANLLTLLPYPGHPLPGRSRYAALLLAGLRDEAGATLRQAPLLAELDDPWGPGNPVSPVDWYALRRQRDLVLAYVTENTSRRAEEVLAFTVFTTQDPTAEMEAVAATIADLPPPVPVSRTNGTCTTPGWRTTITGTLDLPKWQAGSYPYLLVGGGIVLAGGKAVQQGTERVAFEMTFPCGAAPENGWPILLFMDGTGSFAESELISELGTATLPYVVASIAPLYGGDRMPSGLLPPFDQPALIFFNYLNPVAGRTNQIQQAADMIYLRRVVEGIVLSAEETAADRNVETDDDLVVIAGHSQGALTIPHVLAVDGAFDAGFISAGGAGLYNSVLHRGDARTTIEDLLNIPPGELDMFHPLAHAVQTLAEAGDAANYGPLVTTAHVVSVGGLKDGCSPWEVISHLGTALGLDLVDPIYHPTFGTEATESPVIAFPVSGNLPDGRTGITVQLDTGHFGASTNPSIGRSFVESLAAGEVPSVDPGRLRSDSIPACAGRYDALP